MHTERASASTALQAAARRRAAIGGLRAAVRASTRLQASLRRLRVLEIFTEVLLASRMLRSGNIFVKFSQNGPPHDRWVWADDEVLRSSAGGRTRDPPRICFAPLPLLR